MGKSAVLKDLKNRPAGYLRQMDDCVICRAQLERPAQLALVLCDGTQRVHALSGGAEQRFSHEGGRICGGYVFDGEELLLVSDESMRGVFARQACFCKDAEEKQENAPMKPKTAATQARQNTDMWHGFAQRRWPPSPCWEEARYENGRWQEK